jgi:hypothetical protein
LLNIAEAKEAILQLKDKNKFDKMLHTAAILTDILMNYEIKPIIVGGLSVEIYTMNGYTTQDLDFVLKGHEKASEVLAELDFKKIGKDWVHPVIGISLEIPGSNLAGDYNKVTELPIEDKVVYIIGIEDIILDRLRSAVHWHSGVDREWGFRLLLMYFENLDYEYMNTQFENPDEELEFKHWLEQASLERNQIDDSE